MEWIHSAARRPSIIQYTTNLYYQRALVERTYSILYEMLRTSLQQKGDASWASCSSCVVQRRISKLVLQVHEINSVVTRFLKNLFQNELHDIRIASESCLVQWTIAILQAASNISVVDIHLPTHAVIHVFYGGLKNFQLRVSF